MWARRRRTVPTRSVSRVVPIIQPAQLNAAIPSSTGPFAQPNVASREINGHRHTSEPGFYRHMPGDRRPGLEGRPRREPAFSNSKVDAVARWSEHRSIPDAVPNHHPLRGT
jgi:hypothetical protein